MTNPKDPPPARKESGDESLQRMKDLTKRIVSVPKKELDKIKSRPKPA